MNGAGVFRSGRLFNRPLYLFLRRKLEETEEFSARRHHLEMHQVFRTLLGNWQVVIAGMLMVAMTTTAFLSDHRLRADFREKSTDAQRLGQPAGHASGRNF